MILAQNQGPKEKGIHLGLIPERKSPKPRKTALLKLMYPYRKKKLSQIQVNKQVKVRGPVKCKHSQGMLLIFPK